MKIGDRVLVRGVVDEIRKDTVIIKNRGGYFGTDPREIEADGCELKTDDRSRILRAVGRYIQTQAVARDCLAEAMLRVDAAGYEIVMHVHDEMIVDIPKEDTGAAEKVTQLMSMAPDWAPGLPLKGETYETEFYKKD